MAHPIVRPSAASKCRFLAGPLGLGFHERVISRRQFLSQASTGALAGSLSQSALGQSRAPDYGASDVHYLDSTALADGFSMPGEWETHEATIMVFPPAQNWQGFGLRQVRKTWTDIANLISEVEPVRMVVHPDDLLVARKLLNPEIELLEIPVNDGWSRDTAPLFLKNAEGERRAAGFTFNGWGAKFPPYDDDARLKARLCGQWRIPLYPVDLVAEGGGVILDGQGTIITTEECLLHENRNPGLEKSVVEERILEGLGAKKVIWLPRGLTPDPVTDGHVDGLAAWAAPGRVLLHSTTWKDDPNYPILEDARRILEGITDAEGRALEVITLPLAEKVAHMNFYICNGMVVVPTAGSREEDDRPLGILREVFPDRKVVGVSGSVLARGGGGVHCITQQIPA